MKKTLLIAAILLLQLSTARNVLWEGSPIQIETIPTAETQIIFPEKIIELDVSKRLEYGSDILLTPEGKLFWTPKSEMKQERIIAVSATGTLYIFDVDASTENEATPILTVIDPSAKHAKIGQTVSPTQNNITQQPRQLPLDIPDFLVTNGASKPITKANYPDMAKFAIAHYTGSKRMIPQMRNASKLSVSIIPARWIRTHSKAIHTRMVGAWMIDGHYVTAIYAQNKSGSRIAFDPMGFRGKYSFSATLNPNLEPKGSLGDETIWVFISDVPFQKSLTIK